ncbi:hypothetical protein V8N76_004511 [Salmonella enterica]
MTGREAVLAYMEKYQTMTIKEVANRYGLGWNIVSLAVYRMRHKGEMVVAETGVVNSYRMTTPEEQKQILDRQEHLMGRDAIDIFLTTHETMTCTDVATEYNLNRWTVRQAARVMRNDGYLRVVGEISRAQLVMCRRTADLPRLQAELLAKYPKARLNVSEEDDGDELHDDEPVADRNRRYLGFEAIEIWLSTHDLMTCSEVATEFNLVNRTIRNAALKMREDGTLMLMGITSLGQHILCLSTQDVAEMRQLVASQYPSARVCPDPRSTSGGPVDLEDDDDDDALPPGPIVRRSGRNPVFDECRKNWSGYLWNKLISNCRKANERSEHEHVSH